MRPAPPEARPTRDPHSPAKQLLAARGLHATPLRLSIVHALLDGGEPMSAQRLQEQIAESRPVTLVSTYRALQDLHRAGVLTRYRARNGKLHYGLQGQASPIVFACKWCGDIVSVRDQSLVDALCAKGTSLGFDLDVGALCLTGSCRRCAGSRRAEASG